MVQNRIKSKAVAAVLACVEEEKHNYLSGAELRHASFYPLCCIYICMLLHGALAIAHEALMFLQHLSNKLFNGCVG